MESATQMLARTSQDTSGGEEDGVKLLPRGSRSFLHDEHSPLLINAASSKNLQWFWILRALGPDPVITRLVASVSQFINADLEEKKHIWLYGRSKKLSEDEINTFGRLYYFLQGKLWITETVWPFAAVLLSGLVPGIPSRNLALMLPVFLAPVSLGIVNALYFQLSRPDRTAASTLINCLNSARAFPTIKWLLPFLPAPAALKQSLFRLLWSDPDNGALEETLFNLAQESKGLMQLSVLSTLAHIAGTTPHNSSPIEGASRLVQQRAIAVLAMHAKLKFSINNATGLLYANYLLFSIGCFPANMHGAARFWQVSSYLLMLIVRNFARIIIWRGVVTAIIDLFRHPMEEAHCLDAGMVYQYDPRIGDEECSYCGDWPFIYLADIQDVQACMDGLLALPQSSEELQPRLQRLLRWPLRIKRINLSGQPWAAWGLSEFRQILNTLSDRLTFLDSFNVTNTSLPAFVPDTYFAALSAFLTRVKVKTLDLQGLTIGNSLAQALPTQVSLNAINLNACRLTEEVAQSVISSLASLPVTRIHFASNLAGNTGAKAFAMSFHQKTMVLFDYGNNGLTQSGYDALATLVTNNNVQSLDLSNQDVSLVNFTLFGSTILYKTQALILQNANIHRAQLDSLSQFLANSTIKLIDFSGNTQHEDNAFDSFFAALPTTSLQTLIFKNTGINDDIFGELVTALPDSMRVLDVSSNNIIGFNMASLLPLLQRVAIERLDISSNALMPFAVTQVINALPTIKNLKQFDMSHIYVGDAQGAVIFDLLPETSIAELGLAETGMSTQSLVAFNRSIASSALRRLNIASNPFTLQQFNQVLAALSQSNITHVVLDSNQISDDEGVNFALMLVKAPQNVTFSAAMMSGPTITPEVARQLRLAQPVTQFEGLSLRDNRLANNATRALCRVLPYTKIRLSDLHLEDNPEITRVNIRNCEFNTSIVKGNHTQRFFKPERQSNFSASLLFAASMMPLMLGLTLIFILCYKFYKYRQEAKETKRLLGP